MVVIRNGKAFFSAVMCFIFAASTEIFSYYHYKSQLMEDIPTMNAIFYVQFPAFLATMLGCKYLMDSTKAVHHKWNLPKISVEYVN